MDGGERITRRGLIGAAAALGAAGVAVQGAPTARAAPRRRMADQAAARLPARGEFVVRNAYVLTMAPALGDLPRGDLHVRDGAIVAVGVDLAAPGVEAIDASRMVALPGLVETHFHLWGSFARGLVGDGELDYFPVMSRIGPEITPEDAYRSSRLGLAEALYSGLTTIHD